MWYKKIIIPLTGTDKIGFSLLDEDNTIIKKYWALNLAERY